MKLIKLQIVLFNVISLTSNLFNQDNRVFCGGAPIFNNSLL